jgi:hypothetical protein
MFGGIQRAVGDIVARMEQLWEPSNAICKTAFSPVLDLTN